METLLSYTLEELVKGHAGITIRTQKGTEVMIRIVGGKTLITFPYGNDIGNPESVGVLSSGVLVHPRPSIREQILDSIC